MGETLRVTPFAGPVVYYIRKGDRLKIGYSHRLADRMKTLRPDALLAIEAGGSKLEARRHRQFEADRIPGTYEWYRPSPALVAHVGDIAQLAPVPDLAPMLAPPSQIETACERGHLLIPANVIGSNKGGRACRACHRAACIVSAAQRRGEELDVLAEAERLYALIIGGGR